MNQWIFLLGSGLLFGLMIVFGWRYLPHERFQILASIPVARDNQGRWRGINFTWYGLLLATAAIIGISYVLLLCLIIPAPTVPLPDIGRGLRLFANPLLILGLKGLWFALFLHFGRSIMVTSARLSFEVRQTCI